MSETDNISTQQRKREKAELMFHSFSKMFPDCPIIRNIELEQLIENHVDFYLVDVRTTDERNVSTISGAITVVAFEKLLQQDINRCKSSLVVPFCTIGYRSGQYGTKLKKDYGLTNVRNGEGIVLSTYTDIPLVTMDKNGTLKQTKQVHTYGTMWDLASDRYTTKQFGYYGFIINSIKTLLGFH